MATKKASIIILILVFVGLQLKAQIANNMLHPYGQNSSLKTGYPTAVMPSFNRLKAEQDAKKQKHNFTKSMTFAKAFLVSFSPSNSGSWQTLSDGRKVWRLGISSVGAYSLNLQFSTFKLADGVNLFLLGKKDTLGAFNSLNNPLGYLATVPVKGESLVIELDVPADTENFGELEVSKVSHDFTNVFDLDYPNPACPEGINWDKEIRAVCKLLIDGSTLCTGTLLNNTKFDGTPYVLSARHCYTNLTEHPKNTVFIFNYQDTQCGLEGTAFENQSVAGGSIAAAAKDSTLDFILLSISQQVPADYHPYYSGWSAERKIPSVGINIHHPLGHAKALAIPEAVIHYDYKRFDVNYSFDSLSHWGTTKWLKGYTLQGSSGSALFNREHLVVGDLTGGASSAVNPASDYFTKLYRTFDDYISPKQQLRTWLNSDFLLIDKVCGYDPQLGALPDPSIESITMLSGQQCWKDKHLFEVVLRNNSKIDSKEKLILTYYTSKTTKKTMPLNFELKAFSTQSISISDLTLEQGEDTLWVSISPAVDENKFDNMQFVTFNLQNNNSTPYIYPVNNVCGSMKEALITSTGSGIKNWQVSGASIQGTNFTDTIKISWINDTLPAVQIELSLQNNCGTSIAPSFNLTRSGYPLDFVFQADQNIKEIKWWLEEADGHALYSNQMKSISNAWKTTFCVQSQHFYNLKVMDAGNDGVCCNAGFGYLRLDDSQLSKSLLNVAGYGNQAGYRFYIPKTNLITPAPLGFYLIAPTLADNFVVFENIPSEYKKVNIYDSFGRYRLSTDIKTSRLLVPVSNYVVGMYFFELVSIKNKTKIRKVMIIHSGK